MRAMPRDELLILLYPCVNATDHSKWQPRAARLMGVPLKRMREILKKGPRLLEAYYFLEHKPPMAYTRKWYRTIDESGYATLVHAHRPLFLVRQSRLGSTWYWMDDKSLVDDAFRTEALRLVSARTRP